MTLIFDQFRMLYFLFRGSEEWRSLLRTDAPAVVAAALTLAIATVLVSAARGIAGELEEPALLADLAYSGVGCAIPALLAIMWRRQVMAPIVALTSAWCSTVLDLLQVPLILLESAVKRATLPEESTLAATLFAVCWIALILAGGYAAYRMVRTMLALSRGQAALFVAFELVLGVIVAILSDTVLGTQIILTDAVRSRL